MVPKNSDVFGLYMLGAPPKGLFNSGYSSSHNHGSGKWGPGSVFRLQMGHFPLP